MIKYRQDSHQFTCCPQVSKILITDNRLLISLVYYLIMLLYLVYKAITFFIQSYNIYLFRSYAIKFIFRKFDIAL